MKNPFKLLNSKEVYKNPWISVREDSVVRPDGNKGIFGVVTMIPGSTVLPITHDGYVYITKEYKYAIGSESIEIISGGIDEGETALDAAKRELREEAGLIANKWTELAAVDPFTTIIDSRNHIFIAEDLEETEKQPDGGEIIHVEKIPFEKALQMVMEGEITHAATCVTILKAAQLRN